MSTITYHIPAISCGHCVHTIKTELSDLEGVQKVEGDIALKQVVVEYEAPATLEAMEKLLAEINYPVAK